MTFIKNTSTNRSSTTPTSTSASTAAEKYYFVDALTGIKNMFFEIEETSSPLILDLNGNGVTTTGLDDGVYFDHDGNGFAGKSAWVGQGDGLLVLDRNGNGIIDTGAELFGNNTLMSNGQKATNGFEALADLDHNHDGIIDARDQIYHDLRVWVDKNADGITDEDELFTLREVGVESINTGYANSSYVDAYGNQHKQQGSFTQTDGTTAAISDVWFNVNLTDSKIVGAQEKSAGLASEGPNLNGSGNVASLQSAMQADSSGKLKAAYASIIDDLNAGANYASLTPKLKELVLLWSGSADYQTNSRGKYIDGRELYALEALFAHNYFQKFNVSNNSPNPGDKAALELQNTFLAFCDYVLDEILVSHTIASLMTQEGGPEYSASDSGFATLFKQTYQHNEKDAFRLLQAFGRTMKDNADYEAIVAEITAFGNNLKPEFGDFLALISHTASYDRMANSDKWVLGGIGDDFVNGGLQDMGLLYGGSGNDKLNGGRGNDVLIGGKGDDHLTGNGGSDTYVFSRGDGNDTVVNGIGANAKDTDKIIFLDIASHEATFRKEYNNLIVDYGRGDSVLVLGFFGSDRYRIDEIHFTDKVVTGEEISANPPLAISSASAYSRSAGSYSQELTGSYNQELIGMIDAMSTFGVTTAATTSVMSDSMNQPTGIFVNPVLAASSN